MSFQDSKKALQFIIKIVCELKFWELLSIVAHKQENPQYYVLNPCSEYPNSSD